MRILKDLFYERSGKRVSLSRTQFWISWVFFGWAYVKVAWNATTTIPDVPSGWVALLAVSGGVYASSKALARQRDDHDYTNYRGYPPPYTYDGKENPHAPYP